jgi:hypothetical protein
MLVSILMVATGIAGGLVIAVMIQSTVRPDRDVRLRELRFDARPRAPRRFDRAEHRRHVASLRRRQLKRRVRPGTKD